MTYSRKPRRPKPHSNGARNTTRVNNRQNSKSLRINNLKAFLFPANSNPAFYHRLPRSREYESLPDFGLALDTDIALPSNCFPSNSLIASSLALSAISTKPNPLDLPVALSVTTFAEVTSPNLSKRDL